MKKYLARTFCALAVVIWVTAANADWESDVNLVTTQSQTRLNGGWCVGQSGDTVHAVWFQEDVNSEMFDSDIWTKHSNNGGSNWDSAVKITDVGALAPISPAIAVNGSKIHVAWTDLRDDTHEIWYDRSTDWGHTWGTDKRLSSVTGYADADHASIAVNGSGVHVVWMDESPGNKEIYYNRSTNDGVDWVGEVRLSWDSNVSNHPSVAVSGSYVHVVWCDDRNGDDEIYYIRSTNDGVDWGSETRLAYGDRLAQHPCIGASGSNVYAFWQDDRPSGNSPFLIYYKKTTNNGVNWGSDTRLPDQPGTADAEHPNIAVNGSEIFLTWRDKRYYSTPEIFYCHSGDGAANWDDEVRLTNQADSSMYPSIAVGISMFSTIIHVLWTDERDGGRRVYYKRNATYGDGGLGISASGNGESPKNMRTAVKPNPNPFVSYTAVPGGERKYFALYDISGRQVGTYRGDRIGENARPGIYFMRDLSLKDSSPKRIVKLK